MEFTSYKPPEPPKKPSSFPSVQGASANDLHPADPDALGFLIGDKAKWPVEEGVRVVRIHRIYKTGLGDVCASVIVDECPSGGTYQTVARLDWLRKWDDPEGVAELLEQNKPTAAQAAAKAVLQQFTGSQDSLW